MRVVEDKLSRILNDECERERDKWHIESVGTYDASRDGKWVKRAKRGAR